MWAAAHILGSTKSRRVFRALSSVCTIIARSYHFCRREMCQCCWINLWDEFTEFFSLIVTHCSCYWVQLIECLTFKCPITLKLSETPELKGFHETNKTVFCRFMFKRLSLTVRRVCGWIKVIASTWCLTWEAVCDWA